PAARGTSRTPCTDTCGKSSRTPRCSGSAWSTPGSTRPRRRSRSNWSECPACRCPGNPDRGGTTRPSRPGPTTGSAGKRTPPPAFPMRKRWPPGCSSSTRVSCRGTTTAPIRWIPRTKPWSSGWRPSGRGRTPTPLVERSDVIARDHPAPVPALDPLLALVGVQLGVQVEVGRRGGERGPADGAHGPVPPGEAHGPLDVPAHALEVVVHPAVALVGTSADVEVDLLEPDHAEVLDHLQRRGVVGQVPGHHPPLLPGDKLLGGQRRSALRLAEHRCGEFR